MQSLFRLLPSLLLLPLVTPSVLPLSPRDDGDERGYKTDKSTLRPETYEYIEGISKSMDIPGFTAVFTSPKGDEIWTYGRKDGAGTPVDPQTWFGMASNSKLVTGVTLATIQEQGHYLQNEEKFELTSKMKDVDPAFKMANESYTDEATVYDFLTMYTGLPGHNLALLPNDTNQAAFDRLADLQANIPPEYLWQYCNIGYVIGGYVVDKITGRDFYEVADEIIFQQLGLDGTSDATVARASGHLSQGFLRQDVNSTQCALDLIALNQTLSEKASVASNSSDKPDPTAYPEILQQNFPKSCMGRQESVEYWTEGTGREWGGGGSFIMSGEALLKWVKETLAPQKISQSVIDTANTGIVNVSNIAKPPGQENQYGLGTIIGPYQGYKMSQHDGALPGSNSQFMRIYNESTGVFVVVNEDYYGNQVKISIAQTILDDLLGLPPTDHFTGLLATAVPGLALAQAAEAGNSTGGDTSTGNSESAPSTPVRRQQPPSSPQNVSLDGYLGETFTSPGYLPQTLQQLNITDPKESEDKYGFPVDFLITDVASLTGINLAGPHLIAEIGQSFATHMIYSHWDGPYWNASAVLVWERWQGGDDSQQKRDEEASGDGGVSKYIGKYSGGGPAVFGEDGIGIFGNILTINTGEAPIPEPVTENIKEKAALFFERVSQ